MSRLRGIYDRFATAVGVVVFLLTMAVLGYFIAGWVSGS